MMARARPLMEMMQLFRVAGVFAPSSIHAAPAALNCAGVLTLPGGARRKVILAVERRTPASRGMLATRRLSYGCGPSRRADGADAFCREIGGAVAPVLARIATREAAITRLWPRAARSWTAEPLTLDVPESVMGGPVPTALIDAVHAKQCHVIDLGVHLRSGCLQRCAFCRREPRRYDAAAWDDDLATVKDLVRRVVRPAARRGLDIRFRVEADDLAGHGRLTEIMALLAPETAFGLHLVMPPNRLADPAAARRVAALPGLESVTFTVFGCTPRTHDAIAGRAGAFRELLAAARNIHAAAVVPFTLNAVLTDAGVGELGGIIDAARLLGASLSISSLFADSPRHHPVLAIVAPSVAVVRSALGREESRIVESAARLQDFPVCAVPAGLRPLLRVNRVMETNDYPALSLCSRCVQRPRCLGVPRGYLDAHGTGHLVPEAQARTATRRARTKRAGRSS
ncbi:MAG: hypothetical protein HY897_10975 [Deltaproteobacteria bacterium]|nr:hypothetical protein [Deltaproteobacteria bacterium]